MIAAYTVVGFSIVGAVHFFIRRHPWRWLITTPLVLVVAALALGPFLEEARMASQFAELCSNAGVHVQRKVEAGGFYDGTMQSAYVYIDRSGYSFMEQPTTDRKKVEHVERVDGKWQTKVLDRPSARYHLLGTELHKKVGHRIYMDETIVLDSQTGEVISRATAYKRYANSVDQAWAGMIGSTLRICPDPGNGPPRPRLVGQTIVPAKR
jgi:hypothetical protein